MVLFVFPATTGCLIRVCAGIGLAAGAADRAGVVLAGVFIAALLTPGGAVGCVWLTTEVETPCVGAAVTCLPFTFWVCGTGAPTGCLPATL